MAFASVGTLGTNNNAVASTSVAVTLSAIAEAGNLLIAFVIKDNAATTTGVTNEVTSVTDSAGGNTWTKMGEYCYSAGAENDGLVVAAYQSRLANQIPSAGTVTLNFSDSRVAKCSEVWEFTVGAAVQQAGTTQTASGAATADIPSMALSGLSSLERLYFRLSGGEDGNANRHDWVVTTSYTKTTVLGSGGNGPAHQGGAAEFIISTGTGSTSDPGAAGSTCDRAHIFFALEEIAANTPYNPWLQRAPILAQ